MSGGIFISYRREDTQHAAARLSDRLEDDFTREGVFFDVETLPPGVDFVEEVAKKIDACGRCDGTAVGRAVRPVWLRRGSRWRRPVPVARTRELELKA